MIELAMHKFGVSKNETIIIGDRVYTDIAAGNNAGIETIMVLSGEGTIEETKEKQLYPTLFAKNIAEVADMIETAIK